MKNLTRSELFKIYLMLEEKVVVLEKEVKGHGTDGYRELLKEDLKEIKELSEKVYSEYENSI